MIVSLLPYEACSCKLRREIIVGRRGLLYRTVRGLPAGRYQYGREVCRGCGKLSATSRERRGLKVAAGLLLSAETSHNRTNSKKRWGEVQTAELPSHKYRLENSWLYRFEDGRKVDARMLDAHTRRRYAEATIPEIPLPKAEYEQATTAPGG